MTNVPRKSSYLIIWSTRHIADSNGETDKLVHDVIFVSVLWQGHTGLKRSFIHWMYNILSFLSCIL